MDDITTRFERCLRRHLRWVKPDSVSYAVELVQLGLDFDDGGRYNPGDAETRSTSFSR